MQSYSPCRPRAVLQLTCPRRMVRGGFFFHPSDEDLSPGTPERKKPLESNGFGVHQLENSYSCSLTTNH